MRHITQQTLVVGKNFSFFLDWQGTEIIGNHAYPMVVAVSM